MDKPPPPERYGSRKGGFVFYTLIITNNFKICNSFYELFKINFDEKKDTLN